jgi:hypothetical protein
MYRYRQPEAAVTRKSLIKFKKHRHKIGEVVRLKGYCYIANCHKRVVVLIVGTTGTMRLDGFAWGYGGEGPRGLRVVLEELKVPEDAIANIIATKWDGLVGTAWSYKCEQRDLA